jgi:hypothetical protein
MQISSLSVSVLANLEQYTLSGLNTLPSSTQAQSSLESNSQSAILSLFSQTTLDAGLYTSSGTLAESAVSQSDQAAGTTDETATTATAAESKLEQDAMQRYFDLISHQVEYLLGALIQGNQNGQSGTGSVTEDVLGNGMLSSAANVSKNSSVSALDTQSDYYSAEKTAARIVDFALSFYDGGDKAAYAEKIKAAVTKGFEQALSSAGGSLPQISYDTINLALDSIDSWAAGTEE